MDDKDWSDAVGFRFYVSDEVAVVGGDSEHAGRTGRVVERKLYLVGPDHRYRVHLDNNEVEWFWQAALVPVRKQT